MQPRDPVAAKIRHRQEVLANVREYLLDVSEGKRESVPLTPDEAEVLLNLPGLTAPSCDHMRSY